MWPLLFSEVTLSLHFSWESKFFSLFFLAISKNEVSDRVGVNTDMAVEVIFLVNFPLFLYLCFNKLRKVLFIEEVMDDF